jgi:hypothetical protein
MTFRINLLIPQGSEFIARFIKSDDSSGIIEQKLVICQMILDAGINRLDMCLNN